MSILNKLASFFNRRDKGDLKLFTEVVDGKLKVAGDDISLLELEYNLRTATGEWLDEWGSWFGVYRGMDEDDDSYRYRILTSLARATGTIPAILASVLEYYEVTYGKDKYNKEDITILEPYTLLKKFSECGDFSGIHRYPDGTFYRHHTLEITIPESVTPELREMVEKTKAAGIKVYYNISQSNLPSEDGSNGVVSMTPQNAPTPNVTLQVDLEHAVIMYGSRRSKFVPPSHRGRSGRKILDTIETFIKMDFDLTKGHTYKEISEFWKIMCKYGHTTPVWVPKTEEGNNALSENLGARSGDRDGHWEYQPVEEVFKDADDCMLQLPVVQTHAFIKPARRSRCGNGHSMGYPRSGLQGEDYDYTQKEYVQSDNYLNAYWNMVDWADTTIITTVEVEPEKPLEVITDKFFVTEHVHDEDYFNIVSNTVRMSDAVPLMGGVTYEHHTSTDKSESVLLGDGSLLVCETEHIEEIPFTTMLQTIDAQSNVMNDITVTPDVVRLPKLSILSNEFIENECIKPHIPIAIKDMDNLLTQEVASKEDYFDIASDTVTFRDAGEYGSDIPLMDVLDPVDVQSRVMRTVMEDDVWVISDDSHSVLLDDGSNLHTHIPQIIEVDTTNTK